MRWVILLAVTALTASRSEAGMICMASEDFTTAAADLESFAKDAKNGLETTSVLCLRAGLAPPEQSVKGVKIPANYGARIEKACTKVLERDRANELCVELAVRLGKKELAGIVLVDAALGWTLDVWNWDGPQARLWVLGQLGDPRGATKIVDVWKASLAKAKKWEKRSSAMQAWSGWRKEAAETIGKLGVEEHATFLREQAAATKDRYVERACLEAAKTILVRVLKQP